MFCRRRGQRWRCVHRDFPVGQTDSADGRLYVHCVPGCIWCGFGPDYLPQNHAARESGRGAPQARLSADGQRAGYGAYVGIGHLYYPATGHLHRPDPDSGHIGLALGLSYCGLSCAGCGLHSVYAQVLSFACGVFRVAEEVKNRCCL